MNTQRSSSFVRSAILACLLVDSGWTHSVKAQEPEFLLPRAPSQIQRVPSSQEMLFPPSPEELAREGDLQRAERELRDFLDKNPGNEEAIVRLGLVLLRQGRTQESIDFLYQQHTQYPSNAKIASALGQAMLEGNCICPALDMFCTASMLDPNLPDIHYWIGLAQLRAGTPLAAYHTLLSGTNSNDDSMRAQQLLRGTALASLGLQCEASALYQGVAYQAGDTPLGRRAQELQSEMDQALCCPPRHRGFFKVGFRYDDNPGVIPTTNIFGTPAGASTPTWGNSYASQFMYDLYRGYNRDVIAGYTMFGTLNYRTDNFDLLDNAVFLAMAQRGLWNDCLPYTAGLRFDFDHLTIGQDSYLGRFGVTPTFTLVDSDFTSTTFLYRYTNLNFLGQGAVDGTAADADSNDHALGFFRQCQNECRDLTFLAGYMYDNNQSQGGSFNYNGHNLQGGVTWLMPYHNMQLNALGQVYFRDYYDLGAPRNDTEYVAQVLLLYPVRDRWYLTLGWLYDRNVSNLATSDYKRNVVELGLQYNFPQGNSLTPGLFRQRTTY